MSKNVHIIAHSHWDREWYMPFEYHRSRLIKLIDACIELFEKDPDFNNFHLDGHTALLEDYLEFRPENREKIKKFVAEGKFTVGPWYVLQDEFLTSSEANIRNLLVGMDLANSFGKVSKIGYFPDAFGNVGQMPQILKQAGMKAIVFGRGVKPTGINSETKDGGYESKFSEMYWQSPDGSKLLAVLFANWYNNGQEIPANANGAFWNRVLSDVEKYASTNELLVMNGFDHQPVQKDLTQAISAARKQYPDYNFKHSSFPEYIEAVAAEVPTYLNTIHGELTSQDTDGWMALVNTSSSQVDLKIMNRKTEILLESIAEPLSTIAAFLGKEYPHGALLYSWKTLMQNHPHDSICGCSCDAVNTEIRSRFLRAQQSAEMIVQENTEYIAEHIDTSAFSDCEAVFCVMNTLGAPRRSVLETRVHMRKIPAFYIDDLNEAASQLKASLYTGGYILVDEAGNAVPADFSEPEVVFDYKLPDDCCRKPFMAEAVTVSFETDTIPAMGYKVYGIKKSKDTHANKPENENTLENDYIRAVINEDGTVRLVYKETGRVFENILRFEDLGDIGNEYTFVPVPGDTPIYSGDVPAEIECIKHSEYVTEYKVVSYITVPKSANEVLKKERDMLVAPKSRTAGRSKETVTLPITSYISLSKHGKRLDIKTEINNTVKDHRLRVIIPTGLAATQHKAESVFEAAVRNNVHKPTWVYPSGCEHQQGFVMMRDSDCGIAVANIGLYEYEITDKNEIAVTLVRSVAELGDWGWFPTELSQVQKELSFSYAIVPYTDEGNIYNELEAFRVPFVTAQLSENANSAYKSNNFVWSGNGLRVTAFKHAMHGNDTIVRWVNFTDKEQLLTVNKTEWINNLYRSNVVEEKGAALCENNGKWEIAVKPHEIITLGCSEEA